MIRGTSSKRRLALNCLKKYTPKKIKRVCKVLGKEIFSGFGISNDAILRFGTVFGRGVWGWGTKHVNKDELEKFVANELSCYNVEDTRRKMRARGRTLCVSANLEALKGIERMNRVQARKSMW